MVEFLDLAQEIIVFGFLGSMVLSLLVFNKNGTMPFVIHCCFLIFTVLVLLSGIIGSGFFQELSNSDFAEIINLFFMFSIFWLLGLGVALIKGKFPTKNGWKEFLESGIVYGLAILAIGGISIIVIYIGVMLAIYLI